jgi:hypothetical protein
MPERAPPRRSSTVRFAAKLAVVAVVVCVAVYFITLADLQRSLKHSLDRLHAAGVPATWAQMAPGPVPDEENAAVLYEQASVGLKVSRWEQGLLASFVRGDTQGDLGKLHEVEQIIARERLALELLERATGRRGCRFQLSKQVSLGPGDYMLLNALRSCGYLLAADAISAASRGDTAGALAAYRTAVRLSEQTSYPNVSYFFTGARIRMAAMHALRQFLEHSELSSATCESLFRQLQASDLNAALRAATYNDAFRALWRFEAVERHAHQTRLLLAGEKDAWHVIRISWGTRLYLSPLAKQLRLKEEIVRIALMEQDLALVEEPYRDMIPQWPALRKAYDRLPRYYMMPTGPLSDPDTALLRDDAIADCGAMQIALALKAYHANSGAYPDSLDALRTHPGWKLPQDPFSGKAFGYRRKSAGFVLYSWGEDLDDDRGRPIDPRSYPPDGDLVWEFKR